MKTRWIGLLSVVIVAAGIITFKLDRAPKPAIQTMQGIQSSNTGIILVANLSEANDKGDNCSRIIHLVRNAGKRGIMVQELSHESKSPLIRRYHVLTIPTVLILHGGRVVSRFEGENDSTVEKIRARLATLDGTGP